MLIRTTTELAHLIRDHRSRSDLTQAQLAELAGVSRKWIVDLEAGKRSADVSLVLRTIKALGLELHILERANAPGDGDVDVDRVVEQTRRGV